MEPPRHLGAYIRAISNAMAQSMRQRSELLGLTSSQSMFLHHLWFRQEKLGQTTYARDLEQFFDIRHSTVSGILQRMEAAGFVTLAASTSDRRCKAVYLTEKALDTHAQIQAGIEFEETRLVANMSPAEVREFRRLLQLAAKNLGVCAPHHYRNKEESTQ